MLASKKLLFEDDGILTEVVSKQQYSDAIEQFITHIRFKSDGSARQWIVYENKVKIIVDPCIRGGLPVFDGTRIDTHLIVQQVEANDYDVDLVARMYEIESIYVFEAITFELAQTA